MSRASRAWMSWPQTAFTSACVTVATRSGRSPRTRPSTGPRSGSPRNSSTNAEWSSSAASMKRMGSSAARACGPSMRTSSLPSARCHVRATCACASCSKATVSTPSRKNRVSSLRMRAERASE